MQHDGGSRRTPRPCRYQHQRRPRPRHQPTSRRRWLRARPRHQRRRADRSARQGPRPDPPSSMSPPPAIPSAFFAGEIRRTMASIPRNGTPQTLAVWNTGTSENPESILEQRLAIPVTAPGLDKLVSIDGTDTRAFIARDRRGPDGHGIHRPRRRLPPFPPRPAQSPRDEPPEKN